MPIPNRWGFFLYYGAAPAFVPRIFDTTRII